MDEGESLNWEYLFDEHFTIALEKGGKWQTNRTSSV